MLRTSLRRLLPLLLVLPLVFSAGCNNNPHPSAVGRVAPAFTIHNGAKTVSLKQFRGHVVVLNFWASWCPPCLEEFPSLMQLQKDLPNIRVVAVSFDKSKTAYQKFLVQNHIKGIVTAVDPSGHTNLEYGTHRPPETYIISPKGVIERKVIGPVNWTSSEMINYLKNLS